MMSTKTIKVRKKVVSQLLAWPATGTAMLPPKNKIQTHVLSPPIKTKYVCYQFRVPRNLRIDIKDRLEEYSQSIEIDIHDCTQSQKSQLSSQILKHLVEEQF